MSRAGTITKGAALASFLMLAMAGPAGAHAEFEGEAVPAGTHQALALHVPGERAEAHNVKVVVTLPAEFELLSCEIAAGWSCTATSAAGDDPAQVIYTLLEEGADHHDEKMAAPADEGHPEPPADGDGTAPEEEADMFHFSVHTPGESGTYAFPVEQHYSRGGTVQWNGTPDSDRPAPVVTVNAPA